MLNKKNIEAEVIYRVFKILNREEVEITLESTASDTPGWDSLANLEIIDTFGDYDLNDYGEGVRLIALLRKNSK